MSAQSKSILAVVLAAGRGTRMKSGLPKVLHEVSGKTLLEHVMDEARAAGVRRTVVVVGFGAEKVRQLVKGRAGMVLQMPQRGTGHAVLCTKKLIGRLKNDLLILPGDASAVRAETLRAMIKAHRAARASATILTACVKNPFGYGRILRQNGEVVGIREELDANSSERQISEINSGIYLFDTPKLFQHLARVKAANKKNEYYLTDVIESFVEAGLSVVGFQTGSENETLGVNSRLDLAKLGKEMNRREIEKHQKNGVTILSPDNTFIASGATIGKDTVIYPFSWIERDVKIGRGCRIGPFATIRKNSRVDDAAVIGCFVEVVRSRVGKKSRVKHLSYIGDATLGEGVNIGAGTVTANFDGVRKQKTVIQKGASIGSNTVLVAPVRIGANAKTGAGSVVLSRVHVPAGKLAVGVPAKILRQKRGKR